MRASVGTESALRSHSVRIYTLSFYISFVNYRVEPVLASKTVGTGKLENSRLKHVGSAGPTQFPT